MIKSAKCIFIFAFLNLINDPVMTDDVILEPFCRSGDINILMLHSMRYSCTLPNAETLHQYSSIPYIFKKINANPLYIFQRYNLTLGYLFYDPCEYNPIGTISYFTRQISAAWQPSQVAVSSTFCERANADEEHNYRVSGIIGCWSSSCTTLVSQSLKYFKMPQIATESSADALSDKSEHPYLARMVASDSFQAIVIKDIIRSFNWSYIIIMHSENVYSRGLATNLRIALRNDVSSQAPVCIAYTTVYDTFTNSSQEENNMLQYLEKAQVIVSFTPMSRLSSEFLRKAESLNTVFIMGDNGSPPKNSGNVTYSSIFVTFKRNSLPEFNDWFRKLNYQQVVEQIPNGQMIWENMFECCQSTEKTPNCSRPCNGSEFLTATIANRTNISNDTVVVPIPSLMDATTAMARVLSELAEQNCVEYLRRRDIQKLNWCLQGQDIYSRILNTSFTGFSGKVAFDLRGDALYPEYTINQQQASSEYPLVSIGAWDTQKKFQLSSQRALRWRNNKIHVSLCAQDCPPRHFKLLQSACCWSCHQCRPNERLLLDKSQCRACPEFWWPSDPDGLICQPININFTQWNSNEAIIAMILALLGAVLTSVAAGFVWKSRRVPLMKACAVELSLITMIGLLIGYLCMLLFLGQPTQALCAAQLLMYNLSLAAAYAPLLVKTLRIYRVFASAMRGRPNPSLVSTKATLTLVVLIWMTQLAIESILIMINPPLVVYVQLDAMIPFVEAYCPHQVATFLAPLGVNLALVLVCAGLAFKTRALPDNFHDSKCIFACAACCVFLWMAFVPSVITSRSGSTENVLLSFALFVNSSLMLVTLFGPKIYAIIWRVTENSRIRFYGSSQSIGVAEASAHENLDTIMDGTKSQSNH